MLGAFSLCHLSLRSGLMSYGLLLKLYCPSSPFDFSLLQYGPPSKILIVRRLVNMASGDKTKAELLARLARND